MSSTALFDNIADAPTYGGGRYFEEGRYRLQVREVKIVDSSRKKGTQFFIVSSKILFTTANKLTAGDTVGWRVDLTQPSGFSNVKQFALAVGQTLYDEWSEDDVDSKFLKELISDFDEFLEEECEGELIIGAEASQIKTKEDKDFTKVVWAEPEEEDDDDDDDDEEDD